jgi:hypothetical protein
VAVTSQQKKNRARQKQQQRQQRRRRLSAGDILAYYYPEIFKKTFLVMEEHPSLPSPQRTSSIIVKMHRQTSKNSGRPQ